jgi:hypothetical protein
VVAQLVAPRLVPSIIKLVSYMNETVKYDFP